MRVVLLALLLPGMLAAQELQTRARASTTAGLPTRTTVEGGVRLDPNAPVIADMPGASGRSHRERTDVRQALVERGGRRVGIRGVSE